MVPGHLSLSLNMSKTKELIGDFRKRQQRPYTPLMISGTPEERVTSFKYLGVNLDFTHSHTGLESQAKTLPSATAEKIQGLASNVLFSSHRKCTDSVHLRVVWECLQSGLQSSAESCALT